LSSPPVNPAKHLTASVVTLGCKVNQFESAAMQALLREAGYTMVPKGHPADLTIINTCTVTHRADFESRNLIRRASRANPEGRIVATGCLAQVAPDELAEIDGVTLVLGQDEKPFFLEHLQAKAIGKLVDPPGRRNVLTGYGFPEFDRTRAFFRIQDGCNAACAYCAVPRARGPSRSLAPDSVISGLDHYHSRGYKEVVLTGIHLGAWGQDLEPPLDLAELLSRIVDRPGPRIRLSSIEPNEVTDAIVDMARSGPSICPHLHLPLQSGSDTVLKAMRRPYTAKLFEDLVTALAEDNDEFCIGADVLVGFPGEDAALFEETRSLLERLPLAYFHVFPYSRRPRTMAGSMPDQVPEKEKKARVKILRELGRIKRIAFHEKQLGRIRPTLIETTLDSATGLAVGVTDNYIRLLLSPEGIEMNTVIPVKMESMQSDGRVLGRPVK
jgi:threonylcarbamoyladenosine tRNA methylthiotransferase MtaB